MKKSLIVIWAAVAMMMTGCVKNLEEYGFAETTIIKGKVIEGTEHVAVAGVNTSITNGSRTYASYTTSEDGLFELEVNFNEIDKDYYLFLSGKGKTKKYDLKGMGQELYDYRDVTLYETVTFATFEHDGIIFDVYPTDINNKTWDEAQEYCAELVYADYDDWALPSINELSAMYENRGSIGGFSSNMYWSGTMGNYSYLRYVVDFGTGNVYSRDKDDNYRFSFRPVRISTSGTVVTGAPTVTTTAATLSGTTVTTGGNVTKDGGETITARGVCYGNQPYPDLTGSHTTDGGGTGPYSSTFTIVQGNGTYYIRAYATNANGTSYGEQQTVIHPFDELPTFQYGGHTYKVAPDPGNYMEWSAANSYCNNLSLHGVSGWKMPMRDELVQMYSERTSIGGFKTNYSNYSSETLYWSSTSSGNGHYSVKFYNGSIESNANTYTCRVRPIKKVD